ncbi:MAG: UTRA domain-containing protein [Rhizobiales bacterium]|nr:UTRA domain-containing protein [Hyphomicrobiales bacterium]
MREGITVRSPPPTPVNSWQTIQAEVMRRIAERIWPAGELIPGEVELAEEFGCARATVNRALRELAEAGILDRKRRAGTRVSALPVRKPTLEVPIIRLEVERRGARHGHRVVERTSAPAPAAVASRLGLTAGNRLLHLRTLHLAGNRPFAYEDRWLNPIAVPEFSSVDLATISANEWLVRNVPLTTGDFLLMAVNADETVAGLLETDPGAALFVVERTTWYARRPITFVRLVYAPGYTMEMHV